MAIAHEVTVCFSTNGADPWTQEVTVPSGTDLLVVGISQKDKTNTISSITWNTTESFTFLRTDSNSTAGQTHIYYLINPTATTANVEIDWSASTRGAMGIVGYSGVDTGDVVDVQNGGEGTDDTAEVTLTGVASDCWAFQVGNADGNINVSSVSHTQRCGGQTGGSPGDRNAYCSQDTNAGVSGDTTLTITWTASGNWSTSAFSFNAFPLEVVSKTLSTKYSLLGFTPKQHNWRWYQNDGVEPTNPLADENVKPTNIARDDKIRLRVCIHETEGAVGSNQDLQIEYSIDQTNWITAGGQTDTDKAFRWADGEATEHNTLSGGKISCQDELGKYHEVACTDGVDIGGSKHHEMDITIQNYGASPNETYYFRILLEATAVELDSGASYPQIQTKLENVTEDYTTYTEVDPTGLGPESGHIQFTANHIDCTVTRDEDAYLYKDKGVGHFSDFDHKLDVKAQDIDDEALSLAYVLANDVDDWYGLWIANKPNIGIAMQKFRNFAGEKRRIVLYAKPAAITSDTSIELSIGTWYYLRIVVSGTSINLGIYSTAALRNEGDGTDGDVDNLSLTFSSTQTFRYIYACSSWNSGHTYQADSDIENLNLQEAVELVSKVLTSIYDIIAIQIVSKLFNGIHTLKNITSRIFISNHLLKNLASKLFTKIYTSFARVSKEFTSIFSLQAILTALFTLLFNVKNLLSKLLSSSYTLLSRVIRIVAFFYSIIGQVLKFLTPKFNLKERLSKLLSEVHLLKTLVSKITIFIYILKESITKIFTGIYSLKELLSKLFTSLYNIKKRLSKLFEMKYLLQTLESKFLSLKYGLSGILSKIFTLKHSLKTLVPKTFTSYYNILNKILKQVTGIYSVKSLVSKLTTSLYNLKSRLSKFITGIYQLKGNVPKLLTEIYSLKSLVPRILTNVYAIKAKVSKLLTLIYDVVTVTVVTKFLTLIHSLKSLREKLLSGIYSVKNLRTRIISLIYNNKVLISKSIVTIANILSSVSKYLISKYLLKILVPKIIEIKYKTKSTITRFLSIKFGILARVQRLLTQIYSIALAFYIQEVTAIPYKIHREEIESTVLRCDWFDSADLDIGYYKCEFWIRDYQDNIYGPYTGTVVKESANNFYASYDLDPDESFLLGLYDLKAEVTKYG